MPDRAEGTDPRSSLETPGREIVRAFCDRPVVEVARDLLGCRLVSTVDGVRVAGMIVETEAYGGPDDPASHANTRFGPTERNRGMFGPPGLAYVYRSHGIHWCLNVVAEAKGRGAAVLIRGLDALEGLDIMRARRGGREPLAAGPGRLAQALAVTGDLYGHDLSESPLVLVPRPALEHRLIGVSGRVGVRRAADWPRRFYVLGATGSSRPDGWNPATPEGRDPA